MQQTCGVVENGAPSPFPTASAGPTTNPEQTQYPIDSSEGPALQTKHSPLDLGPSLLMTQQILENPPGKLAMTKNTTPQKSGGKKRSDLPPGFLRAGGWGVGGGTMSELGQSGYGDPPPC